MSKRNASAKRSYEHHTWSKLGFVVFLVFVTPYCIPKVWICRQFDQNAYESTIDDAPYVHDAKYFFSVNFHENLKQLFYKHQHITILEHADLMIWGLSHDEMSTH